VEKSILERERESKRGPKRGETVRQPVRGTCPSEAFPTLSASFRSIPQAKGLSDELAVSDPDT
jgi:hypothetical protein